MKILLIVDDYLPHSIKVAAKMMHELALEFISQGHEVSVLTPNPTQKEKLVLKQIDGVNVLFFKSGEIKNISKIKRAINETKLSFDAWQASKAFFRKNEHDAIVYYSPSIFWGTLVKKLKRLWRVKSYLILRDVFPQWTLDNGLMKSSSPIYKYFKLFEYINYKNADSIGLMSPSNLEFFKHAYPNNSKFEVLYNWASISHIEDTSDKYRKQLKLNDKVVFFYGGNIGHAQDMMNLVRLAVKMKDKQNAHFLFVGKGDEVELILQEKEKHKLSNLSYLPSVDQNTYFEMLNEFDVGLFTLHASHKTHNFPGKLLGYMEYSKPILGSVNKGNDLKGLINNADAGFVFTNGEDESLYNAAIAFLDDENLRLKAGESGKQLLKDVFSVENTVSQILKTIA